MWKPVITGAALALAALSWPGFGSDEAALEFRSATMYVEYDATAGEAVMLFDAESETTLGGVELRTPSGQPVFELRARQGAGLAEFRVSSQKLELGELLEAYPQGAYHLRARAEDGRTVTGSADLGLGLLAAPVVQHPLDGANGVPTTVEVHWLRDPGASRYRVVFEQNENDGLIVELPGSSESFQVPPGVLAPGTRTRLEIGAIGRNGNCTLVEIAFRTM